MGSVRIAMQNFIDLMVDLDLSRSQQYKNHTLRHISVCAWQIVAKF